MSTKQRNTDVNPFAVEPYPYRYHTMRTDPVGSLYSRRHSDRNEYMHRHFSQYMHIRSFRGNIRLWRKEYASFALKHSKNVIGKFGKRVLLTRRNKKFKYFKEHYCNL